MNLAPRLFTILLMVPCACSREEPPAPAGEPSKQPASLPAPQPLPEFAVIGFEDVPSEIPTAASAASPAAETSPTTQSGVPPFRPLLDSQVGEWAQYTALRSQSLHYEVTAVNEKTVATRVSVSQDGRPLGMPAIREDARDIDLLARQAARAARHAEPVVLQAAGRNWNATLYEDKWVSEDVQYLRRTWVSPQVPVFGMLRMELFGDGQLEARLELVAYGTAR